MPKYGMSTNVQGIDVYLEYVVDETRTQVELTNVNVEGSTQELSDILKLDFLEECDDVVAHEAWSRGQLID